MSMFGSLLFSVFVLFSSLIVLFSRLIFSCVFYFVSRSLISVLFCLVFLIQRLRLTLSDPFHVFALFLLRIVLLCFTWFASVLFRRTFPNHCLLVPYFPYSAPSPYVLYDLSHFFYLAYFTDCFLLHCLIFCLCMWPYFPYLVTCLALINFSTQRLRLTFLCPFLLSFPYYLGPFLCCTALLDIRTPLLPTLTYISATPVIFFRGSE